LVHIFARGESHTLARNVTIDLTQTLPGANQSIVETTLGGNQGTKIQKMF
jgi:hypothetical protein